MTGLAIKPRRRLRSEILPLSLVVALPVAIAWMFPYGALSSQNAVAKDASKGAATEFAFVELGEDEETEAVLSARTAWHVSSEDVKNLRIEMFADDLPEDDAGPVVDVDHRVRPPKGFAIEYRQSVLPSNLRADKPRKLEKPAPAKRTLPFPREDLLKLD